MAICANWRAEDFLQAIGLLGAAVAFGVGVWRYQISQVWKRREFVANEVEKILNNAKAGNALVMLDYTLRTISLFPNRTPEYRQLARLDREYVAAMLIPHEINDQEVRDRPKYGHEGAAIRDCFDELLTRLANLQSMVVARLIKQRDLDPYLAYWINKFAASPNDDDTDKRFRRNLRLYIQSYGYEGVVALCPALSLRPNDEAELRADCSDQQYLRFVEEKRQLMREEARKLKQRYGELK